MDATLQARKKVKSNIFEILKERKCGLGILFSKLLSIKAETFLLSITKNSGGIVPMNSPVESSGE